MREQYPFFREEDERTAAVIGEEAEAHIEADRQLWRDMDYNNISAEVSSLRSRIESIEKRIPAIKETINENNETISDAHNSIERLQEGLVEARENVERYRRLLPQLTGGRFDQVSEYLVNAQEKVEKYPESIRTWNHKITQAEEENKECEELLTTLNANLAELQQKLSDYAPQISAMEEVEARIQSNQEIQENIDYTYIKSEIEEHQAGEAEYQTVQRAHQKVKLFLPCLAVFAACVIALVVLAILRRFRAAVSAAWGAALVGLVCLWLSWAAYRPNWVTLSLLILPLLVLLLGILALWRHRKQTVFQVVHATGAFSFIPSLYPVEELKQFAEEVKLMQSGETDGE